MPINAHKELHGGVEDGVVITVAVGRDEFQPVGDVRPVALETVGDVHEGSFGRVHLEDVRGSRLRRGSEETCRCA